MPIGVSIAPLPVLVRAKSMPPLNVLKIAHGSAVDAEGHWPKPACWNESPEKFAENSSECGAVKQIADGVLVERFPAAHAVRSVAQRGDARAVDQQDAVDDGGVALRGSRCTAIQPAGSAGPVNSAPAVGARITSPSAVCDT